MSHFNRRELIKLGVATTVLGGGYMVKRSRWDPIPDFTMDAAAEAMAEYLPPSSGAFLWDGVYQMKFAQDAIGMANWVESKTGLQTLGNISGHPFPVKKYMLARERALRDGILTQGDFAPAPTLGMDSLAMVHSRSHLHRLRILEATRLGLLNGENVIPPGLMDYLLVACGGTYAAARIALDRGAAMNLNGGFHHAFAGHESGFCYINDVAIAIKTLRSQKLAEKSMIVDLDVHHGDGNASVMMNDKRVVIYDFYQEDNFPAVKIPVKYPQAMRGRGFHVKDSVYLERLKATLPQAIAMESPDIIFYLAGSDPHMNDILGDFKLTAEGLRERDEFVLQAARERNIPVAVVCAGGYPKAMEDIVDILAGTISAVKGHPGKG